MEKEPLNILRHAIGYDDAGNDAWHGAPVDQRRNRFVTDPDGSDGKLCVELVAAGLMFDHGAQAGMGGMHYFVVTEAGRAVVLENKPVAPKLTRSQLRYRAFRQFDSGMTFFEYLKWETRRRRQGLSVPGN